MFTCSDHASDNIAHCQSNTWDSIKKVEQYAAQ